MAWDTFTHLIMYLELLKFCEKWLCCTSEPYFKWYSLYFTDLPLVVNHPSGRPQTSFIKLSPHWPPQHTKLGISWSGLNINLCHSRATADSRAHSSVFCGEFGTNLAKYFKPEGFYYCKPAGLWWPLGSCIQIDLTEFHQGKVIQEISLFLHLYVAVLSWPVDWHWLWGIATTYFTCVQLKHNVKHTRTHHSRTKNHAPIHFIWHWYERY